MNGNEAYSKLKEMMGLAGSVLIAVAALRFAGLNIGIRGEFWQIALMGMALKSF